MQVILKLLETEAPMQIPETRNVIETDFTILCLSIIPLTWGHGHRPGGRSLSQLSVELNELSCLGEFDRQCIVLLMLPNTCSSMLKACARRNARAHTHTHRLTVIISTQCPGALKPWSVAGTG